MANMVSDMASQMDILSSSAWFKMMPPSSSSASSSSSSLSSGWWIKWSITPDHCILCLTDLCRLYVSSTPTVDNATQSNPSLDYGHADVLCRIVVNSLLYHTQQNRTSTLHSNPAHFEINLDKLQQRLSFSITSPLGSGLSFSWTQTLDYCQDSALYIRDQFIVPSLDSRVWVSGIAQLEPVNIRSPSPQMDCGNVTDVESDQEVVPHEIERDTRLARREEWQRKKEAARKRKLVSLQ